MKQIEVIKNLILKNSHQPKFSKKYMDSEKLTSSISNENYRMHQDLLHKESVRKKCNARDSVSRQNHLLHSYLNAMHQNAYRILGLPGDSDYPTLVRHANRIRTQIRYDHTVRTEWDLDWAWPLQRTDASIQEALQRIKYPFGRLREKLYWFSSAFPMPLSSDENARKRQITSFLNTQYWVSSSWVHDAALLNLLKMQRNQNVPANHGEDALKLWRHLVKTDNYWQDLLIDEQEGGFPQPANREDVEHLRQFVLMSL